MKKLLFLSLLLVSFQSKAQVSDSTKTELLIVYFSWYPYETAGVHYYYPNEKQEFTPIEVRSKEQIKQTPDFIFRRQLTAKIFSELYTKGWRLILFNGEDDTYFFERIISK
jgi:hypothetical protein